MSQPSARRSAKCFAVQLIEADFEIGFNLVDLIESAVRGGDRCSATRVLQDAEEVFRDIEQRLVRLGDGAGRPFEGLSGELRRQIDLARAHLLAA